MKSYSHLFEKYATEENYNLAVKNLLKGKPQKKKRKILQTISQDGYKEHILEYARNFKNAPHKPVEIYDGIQRKKRTIIVPSIDEQIVHHMIVNVLQPIFLHGMYEHSYGSIPKRGPHKGKKTIEKWIREGGRNCKYCLKMDIRKYFESIPHEIYLRNLRKIIHDERFMAILEVVTRAVKNGLPLGFYTSQWTANWYLQRLDHYIKEQLGARYYIRYMDDMVIFDGNKRRLHRMRKDIETHLNNELGLEMKDNWQVFRFEYGGKFRPLDFMGFRFYRNRTTLRRSIMLKASRKARRIAKKTKPSIYELRQILSYLGWLDSTDTYGYYTAWVKPYVNIQQCKRRMRAADRRRNGILSFTEHGETGGNRRYIVQGLQLCAA